MGNNINRKRLCAPKQHAAASEKAVKINLAYRITIKWNLEITKGTRDWQNLYNKVSLYRGSFSYILPLLEYREYRKSFVIPENFIV